MGFISQLDSIKTKPVEKSRQKCPIDRPKLPVDEDDKKAKFRKVLEKTPSDDEEFDQEMGFDSRPSDSKAPPVMHSLFDLASKLKIEPVEAVGEQKEILEPVSLKSVPNLQTVVVEAVPYSEVMPNQDVLQNPEVIDYVEVILAPEASLLEKTPNLKAIFIEDRADAVFIDLDEEVSRGFEHEIDEDFVETFPKHEKKPILIASTYAVNKVVHDVVQPKIQTEHPSRSEQTRKVMLQLVEQLATAMKITTRVDRTETTVTLKNIPLFEGVTLTLTEFPSAKGQFNLTFFNLTNPEARALIEMKANQETLRMGLVERGYALQMVTIEPKLNLDVAFVSSETADTKSQSQNKRDSENFDQTT